MTAAKQCEHRPYDAATDQGLVMSSWSKHIRRREPFRAMDGPEFRRHVRRVLGHLVERARPIMACEPGHPEQVYGWICAELLDDGDDQMQVLHMLYVRRPWRRWRIGTRLLRGAFPDVGERPIYCTHPSGGARHLAKRWKLRPDPYLVLYAWARS